MKLFLLIAQNDYFNPKNRQEETLKNVNSTDKKTLLYFSKYSMDCVYR